MKIHVLHTGSVTIDQALAHREDSLHPMPYTGWFRSKKKRIEVPVSAYLIQHPKGNILIDTGWHAEIRTKQKKHLGRFSYSMFQGKLPKGEAVHEQLLSLHIQPSDLDLVILTHLHADHVSGLEHVKEARKIWTSDVEWKEAHTKLGYIRSLWKGIPIEPFTFTDIPFGPTNRGVDVWGDESLYIVHTPGHTRGMVSILAKVSNGWLLLASDVGYSSRSFKEQLLPGLTSNKKEALQSLQWVDDFSKRSDCIGVLANHDPRIDQKLFV
ncbi:N-acyl homoserine lactonase family protein [Priestia koreensis]|uniref:N-acyl homoserine lactonase family protein n=1 Tax=Priestia koreensis TaxID=284581 RepID=UPI002040DA52|nr:N-acyl homoserine lactonase family protein [Priestia koreensis]MCM3005183.1 N-acyl homoserine lactonase family protein [Priestia koreensis]